MNIHPFTVSLTPDYLYITPALEATRLKVRFVLNHRQGLTCIMGDVGMGKSSILRLIYGEYVQREDVRAVLIPTPSFVSEFAFLKGVCQQFQLRPRRSLYDQQLEFENYLNDQFAADRNVIVFIDEAQMLKGAQLEMVRTMLNFEDNNHKLIQIVLAAQLELRDSLKDASKKALRSRIVAPSILAPLTPQETAAMIRHRCDKAGITVPFTDDAIHKIYTLANGTPRDVLKICSTSYELAQGLGEKMVTVELVEESSGVAVFS